MNVEQLRHILRAAAAITGEKVFVSSVAKPFSDLILTQAALALRKF